MRSSTCGAGPTPSGNSASAITKNNSGCRLSALRRRPSCRSRRTIAANAALKPRAPGRAARPPRCRHGSRSPRSRPRPDARRRRAPGARDWRHPARHRARPAARAAAAPPAAGQAPDAAAAPPTGRRPGTSASAARSKPSSARSRCAADAPATAAAKPRFSRTVSAPLIALLWPIRCSRARCSAGSSRTGLPSHDSAPAPGARNPASRRSRLDLPAPFGPRRSRLSPGASANDTPANTRRPPRTQARSSAASRGRLNRAGAGRRSPCRRWRARRARPARSRRAGR